MPDLEVVLQQLSAGRARLESISGSATLPDHAELVNEIAELTEQLLIADEELRVQDEELRVIRTRLATATSRWERAFAAAPAAYLVTDMNGIVTNTNRVARELLREPAGSTRVRPIASKFEMGDRGAIRELIRQASGGVGSVRIAATLRRGDGSLKPVQVSAVSADIDGSGEPILWWHLVPLERDGTEDVVDVAPLLAKLAAEEDPAALTQTAADDLVAVLENVAWALVYVRDASTTDPQRAVTAQVHVVAAAGIDPDAGVPRALEVGIASAHRSLSMATPGKPDVVMLPLSRAGQPPEGLLVVGLRAEAGESTLSPLLAVATALGNQLVIARELHAERERVANLNVALETNRRIGAALGILMARHKVTDTQAFDMLRTASQRRHVKLRELAEDVLLTGELTVSSKDAGRSTG